MNIQKYKSLDCSKITAEADEKRPNKERQENIEKSMSKYNYSFTNGNSQKGMEVIQQKIKEHEEHKPLRKDAVLMIGVCITMPKEYLPCKDVDKDEKRFFAICKKATLEHFGLTESDVVMDVVHKDETTPHMHLYLTPTKNGVFNAKQILTPDKFKTYHDKVDLTLKREMKDIYKGGITLSEDQHIAKKLNLEIEELQKMPLKKLQYATEYKLIKNKAKIAQEAIKLQNQANYDINDELDYYKELRQKNNNLESELRQNEKYLEKYKQIETKADDTNKAVILDKLSQAVIFHTDKETQEKIYNTTEQLINHGIKENYQNDTLRKLREVWMNSMRVIDEFLHPEKKRERLKREEEALKRKIAEQEKQHELQRRREKAYERNYTGPTL